MRRRRVKPVTQKIYQCALDEFRSRYSVNASSDAPLVDKLLDQELVRLYLAGETPAPGRILYYAVRWDHCWTAQQLPLSTASRLGHAKTERARAEDPETWESILLAAEALLTQPYSKVPLADRAVAACAMLLSFDVYARGGDLVGARKSELRAPVSAAASTTEQMWTLTLFPVTESKTSKTDTQDESKLIGLAPERAWISKLCPLLLQHRRGDPRLIPLDQTYYVKLFHDAHNLAQVPASHPHRLRHGGASVDALRGVTDFSLMERGGWRSPLSVQRYRKPARYLRQLELLSRVQLVRAKASPTVIWKIVSEALGRRKRARS